MAKLDAIIKQFESATRRLEDVLAEPKSDIVRDSAIKRFELAFDLSWKVVKAYLEIEKGIVCRSPKDAFREAYRQGLINYDADWLKYVELRNETVHYYKEEFSDWAFLQLPDVLNHFKILLEAVQKKA